MFVALSAGMDYIYDFYVRIHLSNGVVVFHDRSYSQYGFTKENKAWRLA